MVGCTVTILTLVKYRALLQLVVVLLSTIIPALADFLLHTSTYY